MKQFQLICIEISQLSVTLNSVRSQFATQFPHDAQIGSHFNLKFSSPGHLKFMAHLMNFGDSHPGKRQENTAPKTAESHSNGGWILAMINGSTDRAKQVEF